MPPKAKFTKAEIIEAALNIVRTAGYEALTSRAVGTYLDSSCLLYTSGGGRQRISLKSLPGDCGRHLRPRRRKAHYQR